MKNVIVILMLMVLAFSAFGQQKIEVSPLNQGKKVVLNIKGATDKVDVDLKDAEGNFLSVDQTETIKGYNKVINLQELPEGEYQLVVNTSHREAIFPIQVEGLTLTIKEGEIKQYIKPIVATRKGKTIDISYLNNRLTTVEVSISNIDGETLYDESFANILQLQKRFKLDDAKPGNYTVAIKTPAKAYYHTVALDD